MVMNHKNYAAHNSILGQKIQHPASTKFHSDDSPPAAKRLKTFESTDGEDSRDTSEDETLLQTPKSPKIQREEIPDSDEDESDLEHQLQPQRPTELESALAPVKTDKEAIAEYESMRSAEQVASGDLNTRLNERKWTQGKSSIYVDAFNLALGTVLEDERHLFDEKEIEVFDQWKALEYEAQYL
jgi:Fanconi-associated nuclease 1